MATIFSKIVNGDIPSYKIAETEDFFAFLDIRPLAKGHTLVIPKKEVDYIFDLSDEEYTGLHLFAKKIAAAIKEVVPCERIGMAVVGLEVPHAHIHLVPINAISDMSFEKTRVELSREEFMEIAGSIAEKMS